MLIYIEFIVIYSYIYAFIYKAYRCAQDPGFSSQHDTHKRKVHLSCCCGVLSWVLEPSSGFQHRLRTSSSSRIQCQSETSDNSLEDSYQIICLSAVRHTLDGLQSKGKQTWRISFDVCFCHQKLWPRFRVGFPVSNSLIKRISHNNARQLGLNISLDIVKLTAKISHHSR